MSRPYAGCFVTIMGSKTADRHQRRVRGVPDDVGMWRPYTVLVQTPQTQAMTAFYSVREFKRWLGRSWRLRLHRGPRDGARYSVAFGRLEPAQGRT